MMEAVCVSRSSWSIWDAAAYAKEANRFKGPEYEVRQQVTNGTAFGHWWLGRNRPNRPTDGTLVATGKCVPLPRTEAVKHA